MDQGPADEQVQQRELSLSVHPSVVFKLGEDLISDDVQALVELVKNSWDANAHSVQINIDTTWSSDDDRGGRLTGRIAVRDDGRGMTFVSVP